MSVASVWTDRGLCYYGRAPASASRLCGMSVYIARTLGLRGGATPVNQTEKSTKVHC